MNTPVTIFAHLSPYSMLAGTDLHAATHDQLARNLYFSPHENMAADWLKVGTAQVVVTLAPRADVIAATVAELRRQIEEARADAGVKCMKLEQQINSLLCIENAATEVLA